MAFRSGWPKSKSNSYLMRLHVAAICSPVSEQRWCAVGLAYISDGTHPFLSVTAVATDDDLINQ